MLATIDPKYKDLEALTADTVPTQIRLKEVYKCYMATVYVHKQSLLQHLALPAPLTESEALADLENIARKNVVRCLSGRTF